MKPFIALAFLATALMGGFLLAALRTITDDIGLDW